MPSNYNYTGKPLPEDDRITLIGQTCMDNPGKLIGFVTDADPGKAERYIRKLTTQFPKLTIVQRSKGPVPNTVTVQVCFDKPKQGTPSAN